MLISFANASSRNTRCQFLIKNHVRLINLSWGSIWETGINVINFFAGIIYELGCTIKALLTLNVHIS